MTSPLWTEVVRLSGNNFTVLFENELKVFTAYARFLGNELNSILSFSFYIYEEIKIIKVVILFYIYLKKGFLVPFGTIWFPIISPALKSGSGGLVLE